jgi:hypothetical protein
MPALLKSVDFLYRSGFRKMTLALDFSALWTAEDAARLAAALQGLRRYCRALARRGTGPLEITNGAEAAAASGSGPEDDRARCPVLVLGADGLFYACDKMFGLRPDLLRPWNVGSANDGLEMEGRDAFFREAEEFVGAASGRFQSSQGQCRCALGGYALWRFSLTRAFPLSVWIEGFDRATEAFARAWRDFGRELPTADRGLVQETP